MFRRRRSRDPQDFAEEVRAHLEFEEARLRNDGLSADEAYRQARRTFGHPAGAVERVYEARPGRWIETLAQDVRYGLRLMRRSPGFTVVAVLVLSLGIGANTALFSIVNALFFKPLPVERPEELVYFYLANPYNAQAMHSVSGEYADSLLVEAADLVDFSYHWRITFRFSATDETESLSGEWVTSNYFDRLGVRPILGRALGPAEDDSATTERAVVISHELWTRRFKADPQVLGTQVRLDSRFYSIVGVMPERFHGLSDPWMPSHFWIARAQARDIPSSFREFNLGRLKPGVTIAQVRALLAAAAPRLNQDIVDRLDRSNPNYQRFADRQLRTRLRVERAVDVTIPMNPDAKLIPTPVLAAIVTVVGLVLLIAAANIAGLLLARGVARTGEVAVRRAMGAAGGRLTRQLLTESVLLATVGGVLGLALAANLVSLFETYTPSRYTFDVPLDLRVLLFAVALCVGAGILVGLAPALQAARVNVLEALGAGIVGARQARGRIRHWIVIPQIGLSLLLLLVAGVHVRGLMAIELNDLGYRPEGAVVLTTGLWDPRGDGSQRYRGLKGEQYRLAREEDARKVRTFQRGVLDRVGRVANVSAAALADLVPQTASYGELNPVVVRDAPPTQATVGARQNVVSHGYFEVMGMRLLQGRNFDDRDSLFAPKVAVVSEAVARTIGRAGMPLGKQIAVQAPGSTQDAEWLEVVGVVNDVEPILGDGIERPRVYTPLSQQWMGYAPSLIVRGDGDQGRLVQDVKAAVVGADAFAEVSMVRKTDQIVDEILFPRRLATAILAVSGLIGLALASIGLYGVVSYSVAERVREIGIRTTLGADRRDIALLIVKEGARVAVAGSIGGLVLAILALIATSKLIPNLPSGDWLTFVAVPIVLAAVVLLACYLPARRAARVDPARILRGL